MQIGKAGGPVTHVSQAHSDRVEVRGRDLCGDLMGRLSFSEYFHLLLTGREPTADQRFFLDLLTEAIGIGDIGVSLWGECEEQDGMHLGARGFVHAELIDPHTGSSLALHDGAGGELVLTHLRHRAAPDAGLAAAIQQRLRDVLVVQTHVELVPCGTMQRSDYKSRLVER